MWHKDGEIFYFEIPNSAKQIGLREVSLKRRPDGWVATYKGATYKADGEILTDATSLIIEDIPIEEAQDLAIMGLAELIQAALSSLTGAIAWQKYVA